MGFSVWMFVTVNHGFQKKLHDVTRETWPNGWIWTDEKSEDSRSLLVEQKTLFSTESFEGLPRVF